MGLVHEIVRVDRGLVGKLTRKAHPEIGEVSAGHLDGAAISLIDDVGVQLAVFIDRVAPEVVNVKDQTVVVHLGPADDHLQQSKVERIERSPQGWLESFPLERESD